MDCPSCGLSNSKNAIKCDCGFCFEVNSSKTESKTSSSKLCLAEGELREFNAEKDQIAMANSVCSQCGEKANDSIKFVPCVSHTHYWAGSSDGYTNDDDIEIWPISLCESCMPESYILYLKNRMKSGLKTSGTALVALTISIGGLIFNLSTTESGPGNPDLALTVIQAPVNFLDTIFKIAMFLALAYGVFALPYGAWKSVINFIKLKTFRGLKSIPPKKMIHTFAGEGERIIEEIEAALYNKVSGVYGSFLIPRFKNIKELSGEARQRANKIGSVSKKWRTIETKNIANNIKGVMHRLPSNLRDLAKNKGY